MTSAAGHRKLSGKFDHLRTCFVYMFCVVGETHAHDYFEVISFYQAKIYSILRYVIPHVLRHMCDLHIKKTKIFKKRSKGIKNGKITYSVILSVLSNKTNLNLGFSSPLTRK